MPTAAWVWYIWQHTIPIVDGWSYYDLYFMVSTIAKASMSSAKATHYAFNTMYIV